MITPESEWAKGALDAGAFGITIGTLFEQLPHVAALLTVVWMLIRIFETDTVREWRGKPVKKESSHGKTSDPEEPTP